MILAKLLQLGKSVSIPFGNNQRYDLIVDEGGTLVKAQCKTGRVKDGFIQFKTCSTNGFTGKNQGYKGQVDVFLVYCPETSAYYRVPVTEVSHRECRLRFQKAKNGQSKGVRNAEDFQF